MSKYKFEQKILRIRWVDYERIRSLFPALKNESVSNYFRRLGIYLKGVTLI